MKTYTKDDIRVLKNYNSNTADKLYKIKTDEATIVVDNHEGLGASTFTKQIFYKGFVSELSVKAFNSMCCIDDRFEPESQAVVERIKEGVAVANPCIYIDIDPFMSQNKGHAAVMDFEGADIANAMLTLGADKVPVQFILVGYKADNVRGDKAFYDWLNNGVMNHVKNKTISGAFDRIIFG
jgi:hypothetical protein